MQLITTDGAFWRTGNPCLHTFFVSIGCAFAINRVFKFFYIVGVFSAVYNFIGFQTDEAFIFHFIILLNKKDFCFLY
jgi:hypothetical protein